LAAIIIIKNARKGTTMNEMTNIGRRQPVDFNGPYRLSIGGAQVTAAKKFEVYNPADNSVLALAPEASAAQMNEAVAAAGAAFPAWSALSWEERSAYLSRFADAIEAHKDALARLLTLEQGKPLATMATEEVGASYFWIREVAKRRQKVEILEETDAHIVEAHQVPLGVVGSITPWNFPVLLSLWKIAPCLLTGNTMVVKPSPYTPLCTLRFGEIAQSIFPAGVLNVVSGGNDLGQILSEHPDVAKITFTGSTATGKKVFASGAVNIKRLTLELGGNDPAIVLPDADYKALIPSLFWAAFGNSGQWCVAIKRLYVHASIHADFVKEFVAFASKVKVGDGMDPASELGPIQNRMQFNKLRSMFQDIKDNGYKVPLGGTIDDTQPGNFVPVTVVDNPPEHSRIVQEEPFGPVLPIIAYEDVNDAIARANATVFGLGASVWGGREAAIAVAKRLEAGTVWVNEIHVIGVDLPFGGHKQSGLGVENGHEGLAEFTNSRIFMFKK
jgi:acyl-CoA reductase-like NAD-dependent aldehyde dehydrogenase